MKTFLVNLLAILVGLVAGSIVNMGLIAVGGTLVPLPAGVDTSDMESLAAHMELLEARHLLFPFLAHAAGTLSGAVIAARIAISHQMFWAFLIGVCFLVGGIIAAWLLPAPGWFIAADLLLAYLPMAWLGGWLATRNH